VHLTRLTPNISATIQATEAGTYTVCLPSTLLQLQLPVPTMQPTHSTALQEQRQPQHPSRLAPTATNRPGSCCLTNNIPTTQLLLLTICFACYQLGRCYYPAATRRDNHPLPCDNPLPITTIRFQSHNTCPLTHDQIHMLRRWSDGPSGCLKLQRASLKQPQMCLITNMPTSQQTITYDGRMLPITQHRPDALVPHI
jgi:hypothetical protein